jgi:hypothetical protein
MEVSFLAFVPIYIIKTVSSSLVVGQRGGDCNHIQVLWIF